MLELAGIIVLGVIAQWLAWKTKVPAILPLIIIGLFTGPIWSEFIGGGTPLIHSTYDSEIGKGLFAGKNLFYFVSLAIGIILFEGGLTLKRTELRGVAPAIVNLITVGSLVTFIGGGLLAHYIMGLSWPISFLFAGLIIVTGPTVIAPILRNIPLSKNVSTVLKWEGILIDPIGALVAVLVYEFILSGHDNPFTVEALQKFGLIVLVGFSMGFSMAYALYFMLKKHLIPHYLLNVCTLGLVLFAFVISHELAHESGLLTVVVMGLVLANINTPYLDHILDFKETLTLLLISVLFILLSANISYDQLEMVFTRQAMFLFLAVVFLLRPLGVFLSTIGSDLSFREKLFVSWVGPRGIVAAGVASLFGLTLLQDGSLSESMRKQAELLMPLTFMIVAGTVLINATTARMVARLLGVTQNKSDGYLFVGANLAARTIAKYLEGIGKHVILIDNSNKAVDDAKNEGLEAIKENIYQSNLEDRFDLLDMGTILAVTGSVEVNKFACQKFKESFGDVSAYRLTTGIERSSNKEVTATEALFDKQADYLQINKILRDHPEIKELPIHSKEDLLKQIAFMDTNHIPLFVKKGQNLQIINAIGDNYQYQEDVSLVYLGEEIDPIIKSEVESENE